MKINVDDVELTVEQTVVKKKLVVNVILSDEEYAVLEKLCADKDITIRKAVGDALVYYAFGDVPPSLAKLFDLERRLMRAESKMFQLESFRSEMDRMIRRHEQAHEQPAPEQRAADLDHLRVAGEDVDQKPDDRGEKRDDSDQHQ